MKLYCEDFANDEKVAQVLEVWVKQMQMDSKIIAYCICNKHSVIHEKLNLVHTDLKLENILFMDDSRHGRKYRVPNQTTIRLIDFDGATYEKIDEDYCALRRSTQDNTRFVVDWVHLTGDLLFATHENIEHLAMMEKVLECKIPKHLVKKSTFFLIHFSMRYAKAIEFYEKSLKTRLNKLEPNHLEIRALYNNVGCAYNTKGNYNKAIEYLNCH
ncbi:hypothetical protein RFI_39530 [Reticulomyxa filosa]|uniref:Protein kinase domain-containing protein n=1 Tax=Reticulomyxa filosa TaxID=46433 RepID=X6L913_RETFI|nr:hypothetical protein RFI_39530 [Reticulomyxa filosa]|eukprot:ETN97993.1 hypothetical protein RFI_39530 [Reticulomyxa filosa]